MSNETKLTEADLSKAIDDLIEENFAALATPVVEEDEVAKAASQPANDFKEIPKDTDVKANGGKDAIKAVKSEDEDEDDEEEKEEGKELQKKCKKSEEDEGDANVETLEKSEFESFSKSNEEFQKSVLDKIETMGEIFKGMKYEIDQLKKSPAPRKSVKNVEALNKSFGEAESTETVTAPKKAFEKAEVETAIEELVKSKEISSSVMGEFEMYGKVYSKSAGQKVSAQILKNRK